MKKLLVLAAFAAIFTIPGLAQSDSSKDDLFAKIVKLSQDKKPEKKAEAYKLSMDYLAKFGKDTDEKTKKIAEYAEKYRVNEFNVALDQGRYDDAFELGKELLEINPEDSYVTMSLAYAGYDALVKKNDKGYADASISYAKKTIELFESGKVPKTFVPFKTKDDAIAMMYYSMANLQTEYEPYQSALNYIKALKYESRLKGDSNVYIQLANIYYKAYQEKSDDFQKKYGSQQQETAEMKTENAKMMKLLELTMDSYARAVNLSPAESPNKAAWNDNLTKLYSFVKGSNTGLAEYVSGIMTSSIPTPAEF